MIRFWILAPILPAAFIVMGAGVAFAAEAEGFTRADFDQIMRWVNLLILVALIVKYARRPFMVFLAGKRAEVGRLIARYEEQKRDAETKIVEAQTLLSASQERLALIRDRIVEEGRLRQAEIIEDAQKEAEMLLASARLKISSQIRDAFKQIKDELVDAATREAMDKLPGRITADDQAALIQQWFDSAEHWEAGASKV